MNDLTQYLSVRNQMRAGDVIVFSGAEPISWAIEFITGSKLSHAAVVRQGMHQGVDVKITESTINSKRNGPQTNLLGETLANYGAGARASCLFLAEDFRRTIDWEKFWAFIGAAEVDIHYDLAGLFGWLLRQLPILGPHICQSEDPRQMFCDAYVIAIFEASKALRGINYRKMAPQDLAEMRIYDRAVPILGRPLKIKRFNTV